MKANRLRTFFAAALFAALSWLAACGPGVGGTGTGAMPDPAAAFAATPASVCTAPFKDSLNCPAGAGVAGTPDALTGTGAVRFADVAAGGNVSAVIDSNQMVLVSHCQTLQFTGIWGLRATSEARFFGRYSDAANADTLASVRVTSSALGELQITLLSASEQVLLGPAALLRVDAPVANPVACP
jgi:hypothetical protein